MRFALALLKKVTAIPEPIKQSIKSTEFLVEELEFLRFLVKHCKAPLFEIDGDNPNETEMMSAGEYMIQELEADDLVSELSESPDSIYM